MSLVDFIQKLQQKPRQIRVRIMWAAVSVCMIFIVAGWLWSFEQQTKISEQQAPKNDILEGLGATKSDIPTLWNSLGAGISNFFETAKEKINELKSSSATSSEIIFEKNPSPGPEKTLPVE